MQPHDDSDDLEARSQQVAIEAVRRQAQRDGYGPLFEVEDVRPGHALHRGDGLCPTCGKVQNDSSDVRDWREAHPNGLPWRLINRICFEQAEWVVEFTYSPEGWRAVYGVPAERPAECWMS